MILLLQIILLLHLLLLLPLLQRLLLLQLYSSCSSTAPAASIAPGAIAPAPLNDPTEMSKSEVQCSLTDTQGGGSVSHCPTHYQAVWLCAAVCVSHGRMVSIGTL